MELWKKTETMGCEMEDGSDTRKTSCKFYLVPEQDLDNWNERIADESSYQDYSYSVGYHKIASFDEDELLQIHNLIENKLVLEELEKGTTTPKKCEDCEIGVCNFGEYPDCKLQER